MAARVTKTMTDILKLWQNKHHTNEMDFKAASIWAVSQGLYDKPPISKEQRCENDLRRAVKRATWINPQGNKVRIYGAVQLKYKGELLPFEFVDMRVAKPEIAKDVFDQDLDRIKNDVKRHSVEKQSYDDNNPYHATLPLYDYDLNPVADEARMTGEYDDSFDEDDFNDD